MTGEDYRVGLHTEAHDTGCWCPDDGHDDDCPGAPEEDR